MEAKQASRLHRCYKCIGAAANTPPQTLLLQRIEAGAPPPQPAALALGGSEASRDALASRRELLSQALDKLQVGG